MNGMVRFVVQSASIANIARRTKRRGMKGETSSRCDVQHYPRSVHLNEVMELALRETECHHGNNAEGLRVRECHPSGLLGLGNHRSIPTRSCRLAIC